MIELTLLAMAVADLNGIWVGQIPARNGDKVDIAFQLKQTGTSITGKLYGDYRSTPISEGRLDGEAITFTLVAEEQAGNQINESRLKFTGTVKDGELELTRKRESSTTAGSGAATAPPRNADPGVTFRLKKLL